MQSKFPDPEDPLAAVDPIDEIVAIDDEDDWAPPEGLDAKELFPDEPAAEPALPEEEFVLDDGVYYKDEPSSGEAPADGEADAAEGRVCGTPDPGWPDEDDLIVTILPWPLPEGIDQPWVEPGEDWWPCELPADDAFLFDVVDPPGDGSDGEPGGTGPWPPSGDGGDPPPPLDCGVAEPGWIEPDVIDGDWSMTHWAKPAFDKDGFVF
jgi:hypothetical protein